MTPYEQWLNTQSKAFQAGYEMAALGYPRKGLSDEWKRGYDAFVDYMTRSENQKAT